jgi:hypothetical protein
MIIKTEEGFNNIPGIIRYDNNDSVNHTVALIFKSLFAEEQEYTLPVTNSVSGSRIRVVQNPIQPKGAYVMSWSTKTPEGDMRYYNISDSECKIRREGADIIDWSSAFQDNNMSPTLDCVVGHRLLAVLSTIVYNSTEMIKNYFKPEHNVKYLSSHDPDQMWKINEDCGYAKHRVHAFYEVIEPSIKIASATKSGKINLYIAFRGSHTNDDWSNIDMNISKDRGFMDKRVDEMPTMIKTIMYNLVDAITLIYNTKHSFNGRYSVSIYSCGHSLGGFLALMMAFKGLLPHVIQGSIIRELGEGNQIVFDFIKQINPVVFNPFAGSGPQTMFVLSCIPYGSIHRVNGINTDLASSGINLYSNKLQFDIYEIKNINERYLNINNYPPYFTMSRQGYAPFITGSMTHLLKCAHRMPNFIGSYWMTLQKDENDFIEDSLTVISLKNYDGQNIELPRNMSGFVEADNPIYFSSQEDADRAGQAARIAARLLSVPLPPNDDDSEDEDEAVEAEAENHTLTAVGGTRAARRHKTTRRKNHKLRSSYKK